LTSTDMARTGIVVHLSDCFLLDVVSETLEDGDEEDAMPSALWQQECASLVPRMLRGAGLGILTENRHLSFGGHAGFAGALQKAEIMVASNRLERCLVGAVDSCLDPEFLLAAAVRGLLKTAVNPVGFIPGEAAAFVLIERTADARRATSRPLASFA